ncbi:FLYWCH zinc finger domain-containing protein [Phthorimaea operculella]|nr:FLYWCH zinc finger domain-containing protein [Phthorimaea operculella]
MPRAEKALDMQPHGQRLPGLPCDDTPKITKNNKGYLRIHIGKYTFHEHSNNRVTKGPKKRWACSMTWKGCRAFLTTLGDEIINLEILEFTTSLRGNLSIRIGKYYFGEHSDNKFKKGLKKRWVCSRRSQGCRAFLVTVDDQIVNRGNEHNH